MDRILTGNSLSQVLIQIEVERSRRSLSKIIQQITKSQAFRIELSKFITLSINISLFQIPSSYY